MSIYRPYIHYSSISHLPQDQYAIYMCPDVIFQAFLLPSRLIMSRHVTCHVTAMSHASSSFKISQKEIQKKYKIQQDR